MIRFLSVLTLVFALSQTNAIAQVDCETVPPSQKEQCLKDQAGSGAATPIPEPGTLALFGLGIVAAGYVARKRRK
jgi:hypothetical protein